MNSRANEFRDICFPRMSNSIPLKYIFKIMCKMEVGKIKQILEIPNYLNPEYKRVIVRIRWNEQSSRTQYIQSRFIEEKPIIIVHNNNTFWKALPMHIHHYHEDRQENRRQEQDYERRRYSDCHGPHLHPQK